MTWPAWWQLYLIAGALYSLRTLWNSGFEQRYKTFAAQKLGRTTPTQRIVMGSVAVGFCTLIWLLLFLAMLATFFAPRARR